jgi:hypothetical protein
LHRAKPRICAGQEFAPLFSRCPPDAESRAFAFDETAVNEALGGFTDKKIPVIFSWPG